MQNKWDKEQLEIQRYLGRTNVLGKSLQKGRKIKKSQFHVQKDYIFSQLEIVYLLMWPALVNLIMGLGVWQMFCGKTGLNGDHVNGTDIWAKTEHLWGGFMAVHHEFVVSRQTYLIPWWWGGGVSHFTPVSWLETGSCSDVKVNGMCWFDTEAEASYILTIGLSCPTLFYV